VSAGSEACISVRPSDIAAVPGDSKLVLHANALADTDDFQGAWPVNCVVNLEVHSLHICSQH